MGVVGAHILFECCANMGDAGADVGVPAEEVCCCCGRYEKMKVSCPRLSILRLLVMGRMSLIAHVVLKRFFAVKMLQCKAGGRKVRRKESEIRMCACEWACETMLCTW